MNYSQDSTQRLLTIYDTTLRDGLQSAYVSCTLDDRLKIVEVLSAFGPQFIEVGWPGASPIDTLLFKRLRGKDFGPTEFVAFGSTRRPYKKAQDDKFLQELLKSETRWVTIFGKSSDFHVSEVLKVSLSENLSMISDSVGFLCSHGRNVIYDAEHFFDGYKSNPEYALKTLLMAFSSGAKYLVLCDTNGGTLPQEIGTIVHHVTTFLQKNCSNFSSACLGIHAHNDTGTAVANSLAAVRAGAVMVQGTINGLGERCGNANLCTVIPNLALKLGYKFTHPLEIEMVTEVSRFVSDVLNLPHSNHFPYVGNSAFAHKGGIHINAVNKNPMTYEQILPELVGNSRRILVSSSAGISTILAKAKKYNISWDKNNECAQRVLLCVKELEAKGFTFELAEASFDLVLLKESGLYWPIFSLDEFNVAYKVSQENSKTEVSIDISIDHQNISEKAECVGPISALDEALRKALVKYYPEIESINLTDYKVRILNGEVGAGSHIRVITEFTDGKNFWNTIGVSTNILEASCQAVVSGIEYGLYHSISYCNLKSRKFIWEKSDLFQSA